LAQNVVFSQHSAESAICCLGLRYEFNRGGSVLALHVAGLRAHRFCLELYPLSLKTVARNSSSWLRESWSQRALAVCIREARYDCWIAGW